MELNEIKNLLREMGIVGAGGAGFPSYAKLSDKADTVILNCAECEPLLKVHRQVLEEYTCEILSALSEIVRAVGAERGIIAVKAHYKSTVEALESEISDYPELSICKLRSVYPAGDELILIKEVTGRVVDPGQLPITAGVTVFNAETVYNVHCALNGFPVTHKFVTVAGEVANPITLRVPIGTKISELISAAGGETVDDAAYISGGPMMGKIVSASDVITKTTNAILVLPSDHPVILNKNRNASINLRRAMSVCCQCRTCTELCSRHLLGYPVEPHTVMRVMSSGGKGNIDALAGSMFCSGCGLCESYSCPQDLSPKAIIAELKAAARANGVKPPQGIKAIPDITDAEYKKVSVERLIMRLGLKKYDVPAPMSEELIARSVKIPLSQHIGAPAQASVSVGDTVKAGDIIAKAADGALSVNIHASIDGRVEAVTQKYIKITK